VTDIKNLILTDIQEIITIHSEKGRKVTMKNRQYYGLSFCRSGKITYTHKDKKFISDKTCAVFLPKGKDYSLYGNEEGLFPLINFECEGFDMDTFILIPLTNPESYLKDFEKMKKLSVFSNNNLKMKSIFYDILSRLFSEGITDESILSPAIRYIQNNYSDTSINNRHLASICNVSEVYFRRLFKEQLNTTPKQYILEIRIKRAKMLLENDNLSVTAIAEKCGFSSVYHFCRAFKKLTGITATEFSANTRKSEL